MYLATVLGLKGVLLHLENHYNTINNVTKILLMLLKLSQAAKKIFSGQKIWHLTRRGNARSWSSSPQPNSPSTIKLTTAATTTTTTTTVGPTRTSMSMSTLLWATLSSEKRTAEAGFCAQDCKTSQQKYSSCGWVTDLVSQGRGFEPHNRSKNELPMLSKL